MPPICGDYVVLAPGSYKLGSANYWTPHGALELFGKIQRARAVRFIVNVFTLVIGFQEVAYSVKSRFPEKEVSIHLVYVSPGYEWLLGPWTPKAKEAGINVSTDPPESRGEGELHVSVPAATVHPLVADVEVNPSTFETYLQRVFSIGDSSLIKLGLPPVGWGSLWQATIVAQAIASEHTRGHIEVEVDQWGGKDQESFRKWLTYRMTTGTPLAHLKGLYDIWTRTVLKSL